MILHTYTVGRYKNYNILYDVGNYIGADRVINETPPK